MKYAYILTASDITVIRKAHVARNHCTWQTADGSGSLMPASRTIVVMGIEMLVTNRSARATLTMNALPGWIGTKTQKRRVANGVYKKMHKIHIFSAWTID